MGIAHPTQLAPRSGQALFVPQHKPLPPRNFRTRQPTFERIDPGTALALPTKFVYNFPWWGGLLH